MRIIEIQALSNGAHRNQSGDMSIVPDGWAIIPDNLETPNFPFGSIVVKVVEETPTVTCWTAGAIQGLEPEPESEPTVEERMTALEAAIERGLNL